MTESNFEHYTIEQLLFLFYQSNPHQIKQLISLLTPQQITLTISTLQKESSEFNQKINAAFQGLNENKQLEALGKSLSNEQFLYLLESISKKDDLTPKLSPLLVGLLPTVFFQTLPHLSSKHLEILKQEGILEPLQHHLTVFINECELKNQNQYYQVEAIEQKINSLNLIDLTYEDLFLIQEQISEISNYYQNLLQAINHALAITWNTNRLDLIEKLTYLKETTQHYLVRAVGLPRTKDHLPTGLFATLEKYLFSVFQSTEQPADSTNLQDNDPSIEALTKFSIWYLKDYWELGLLPSIHNSKELELTSNEDKKVEYRQYLFNLVQENLNKLGLRTVADLKKRQIFSKNMLVSYITKHQNKLESPMNSNK